MAERFPGGIISKTPPTVSGPAPGTGGTASGVWTLDEVLGYVQAGIWPGEALPVPNLYTWGLNTNGQLGQNDTIARSSPVQVGLLGDWEQVATGASNTLSVKTDNTLWAWGINSGGELGLNDTIARSSPAQVGALTNWAQVATQSNATACIKTDGTLWTWGSASAGRLAQGALINKSSPVQVGALTDWAKVSMSPGGGGHCIKTDGTLWGWGNNRFGRIGDGTETNPSTYTYNDRSSPVQIGALTNWAEVVDGTFSTACVKTDGTLWTWGLNGYGNLGHNNTIYRSSPVQAGALTNWAKPAIAFAVTACVKTDGTLWTWGRNSSGELGLNDINTRRSSPVQVGALTDWATPAGPLENVTSWSCIKTDGTLWMWGGNGSGVLGQNDTIRRSSPIQVGSETYWNQVAMGNTVAAVITV
jgi:alpha-tubulin suppressor-like RCC1 family protein